MTSGDFISFAPPDIGPEEIEAVIEALRSGWITTGPRAAELETEFASYVGAPAALALSSGTAALHSALLALGIGSGDAVVLPTMTFASAAHVVEHVGARPVLVDSEPETLNLDPDAVERALQDQDVRCIAPVHLHGHPCDMPRIVELAAPRGLAVVEDAAHALPAAINGVTIGAPSATVPSLAAFSFYATKNMTTAEGGMLTGSPDLIKEARPWSLHGMTRDAWRRNENAPGSDRPWSYDVTRAGFKYNLPDIQAAIGLVQLGRLDQMHSRRQSIAARYSSALAGCEELSLPIQREGCTHAWQIYAIRLQLDRLTIDRAAFAGELERLGVGTSVHFIPIHQFTYYRPRYEPGAFPVADAAFEQLISLPIHSAMSDQDVDDVAGAVTTVAARHKR